MSWIVTKYLLAAGVVVLVSELATRSDRFGAFAFTARRFGFDLL